MAKILLLPMEYGIAHTGRLLMVARELIKSGHQVTFSASPSTAPILKKEKISFEYLPEVDSNAMKKLQHLKTNFYSVKNIERFVNSELELYAKIKPDIVVSDLRATVKISTKIAGLPYVTVNNANATKYYDYSQTMFPIPTFFLSEFIPSYLVRQLEREWINKKIVSRIGPKLLTTMLMEQFVKFNYVLGKYKKKPIRFPMDFLEGDLTLISDARFYRPVKKLPNRVKVVGPIFWEPDIPKPSWSDKIRKHKDDGGKVIYLTAGGTGDKVKFGKILNYLSDFPALFIATTGNTLNPKQLSAPRNAIITDYLPGSWVISNSDALIFFGGNLTAYQALAGGVPQIILPLHVDQQDNANQLTRLGTGITINPYKLNKKELIQNISLLLYDKTYSQNARKCQKELKKYNGPQNAAKEIEAFMLKRF